MYINSDASYATLVTLAWQGSARLGAEHLAMFECPARQPYLLAFSPSYTPARDAYSMQQEELSLAPPAYCNIS